FHTLCRSWAQIGTISFIPKLFQDKGWSPTMYGALLSTMWVASAISGVLAGNAADRWGRRQVVMVVMLLSALPLYLLPATNNINFAFLLALLVGGLTGAPHSITVVIAQGMFPGKQATASGIILGLIFGLGAVATFAIGLLADIWTLERTMQLGAVMSILAAVSALALPKTRQETEVVEEIEKVVA
ncbi:MAG: MFS transporter, partial [Chloroflexota bacterium]